MSDCKKIETAYGLVSGTLDKPSSVCVYKGIPYAAPPVGELRWTKPHSPEPWSGEFHADRFGNVCYQDAIVLAGDGESPNYKTSEDCLYLNIWQPSTSNVSLPVMVYIHGGGFFTGSGSKQLQDGRAITSKGNVVLVTFNYRLNVFGLLAHPALRDADGDEGNYSLFDQVAALKWVKDNIASFGGDPSNVTIFGSSAGGYSVNYHILSPLSKGLFNRAIIESGPYIYPAVSRSYLERSAGYIAGQVGCDDPATVADCLRKVPPQALLNAAKKGAAEIINQDENYGLSVIADERMVFENPYRNFEEGKFNKNIEVIAGVNHDELGQTTMSYKIGTRDEFDKNINTTFSYYIKKFKGNIKPEDISGIYKIESYKTFRYAYADILTDMEYVCPISLEVRQLAAAGVNARMYVFEKSPDERGFLGDAGVFHGAEIPFVFGNFKYTGMSFASPDNSRVSDSVIQLWTSFARDGIPTSGDVSEWPTASGTSAPYLRIKLKPEIGYDYKTTECDFFDKELFRKFYDM